METLFAEMTEKYGNVPMHLKAVTEISKSAFKSHLHKRYGGKMKDMYCEVKSDRSFGSD